MKKIFLILTCVSGLAWAEISEEEGKTLVSDTMNLAQDAGKFFWKRVPNLSEVSLDAFFDACLRQIPVIASKLKSMEDTNPTNAAIVRDTGKLLASWIKTVLKIEIGGTGRIHSGPELYAQVAKVSSKITGI